MLITIAAVAGISVVLKQGLIVGIVAGMGIAMSSTAIGLALLSEKNLLGTPGGQASFAVLLFQDLAVVPLLIVLGLLSGEGGEELSWMGAATALGMIALLIAAGRFLVRPLLRYVAETRLREVFVGFSLLLVLSFVTGGGGEMDWLKIGEAVFIVALLILAGRFLVRPVLRWIAETRLREVFVGFSLLVVLGAAALMQWVGLSMALGAFLAGVMLADSEYRYELELDIEPFKGLLLGLFFIAVGMTANLGELAKAPLELLALTAGFLALKAAAVWVAARLSRYGHGTAWRLGASLAGGGEFAFVLLAIAARDRVIDAEMADRLVIVVTLSMIAAPLVIALADVVERRLRGRPAPAAYDRIVGEEPRVLIAGFGRFGQIVGRVLRARHIRFTALEISQAQVDFLRRFGNKLYYGDASRLEMLRAAGAGSAEVLVLAIDDVEASVLAVQIVRRHFPHLRVLARARNRQHAFQLMDAGVERIWRETFGSSVILLD